MNQTQAYVERRTQSALKKFLENENLKFRCLMGRGHTGNCIWIVTSTDFRLPTDCVKQPDSDTASLLRKEYLEDLSEDTN